MPTYQPGDFSLTKIRGGAGLAIRIGQALLGDGFRDFEHAFVNLGDRMIIEVEPGGAVICEMHYAPSTTVTSDWPLTDEQRQALVTAARAYEGVGYGWLDYLALAAHRFHLPIPGLRRLIESRGRLICSAMIDAIYADAGLEMFADHRWPGYVTPADLWGALHGPVTGS
jgi:hypothetical protein